MGENNVTMGPGTLFIKHPDDQDWQPLGTVQEGCVEYHELPVDIPAVVKVPEPVEISTKYTVPPDVAKALSELGKDLDVILQPVIEAWQKIWDEVKQVWDALVDCTDLTFVRAYAWAAVQHPEWVRILNRTKKRRTRKKYQDRIMRAYQKED